LRIIDRGLEKSLVMTGDLGLDLLLIVAFCLIAGFSIAWTLVGWCRLDEHQY
jgi:hypothetical protein